MIRVRFAPSPTGCLHLGGARTALYNFLFARANQGTCILRLEDTDKERFVPGSMEKLKQSLKWLKMDFDEGPSIGGKYGPYVQSERLTLYHSTVSILVKKGGAYPCFCSKERLASLREKGIQGGYDGHCRELSGRQAEEKIRLGLPHTMRMKVPTEGSTVIHDGVYGDISVQHSSIEDQILLKSDGYPTYHLANVVDDHNMQISHVLRGEEWLLSTAKHLLLYSSLNWKPPNFLHLPLLLSSSGGKLSKRNQDVFIESYKERGFLPEAVLNFVAFLGWAPRNHCLVSRTSHSEKSELNKYQLGSTNSIPSEILNLDEMTNLFAISDLNRKSATVDEEKLLWLNKQHFKRKLTNSSGLNELANQLQVLLERNFSDLFSARDFKFSVDYLEKVLLLLEDRVSLIPSIPKEASFFWRDPAPSASSLTVCERHDTVDILDTLRSTVESCDFSSRDEINKILKGTASQVGVPYSKLMQLCRTVVTGTQRSPGLPAVMELLGKDIVSKRLNNAKHLMLRAKEL